MSFKAGLIEVLTSVLSNFDIEEDACQDLETARKLVRDHETVHSDQEIREGLDKIHELIEEVVVEINQSTSAKPRFREFARKYIMENKTVADRLSPTVPEIGEDRLAGVQHLTYEYDFTDDVERSPASGDADRRTPRGPRAYLEGGRGPRPGGDQGGSPEGPSQTGTEA